MNALARHGAAVALEVARRTIETTLAAADRVLGGVVRGLYRLEERR